jgi:hypothetical protein
VTQLTLLSRLANSGKPAHASFLCGDGSVHFILDAIDHNLYQRLGAKNDGQATEWP